MDPGLADQGRGSVGYFLTLQGLSTADRRDDLDWPFGGASSPLAFERQRQRVQATYFPPEWLGLSVRAAWQPTPDGEGFDLEVQASSASYEVLRGLEVTVGSVWLHAAHSLPPQFSSRVESGDSPTRAFPPFFCPDPHGGPGRYYVEMVRPDDCIRRIVDAPPASGDAPRGFSIRHVLFGHDLEKGVVLRGRIRGVWIVSDSPDDEARRLYERFLGEPPALGP